ncbi:MAG TPA: LamG-like jellyroll fold domain-containing protein [Planctomycetota bacterium]|nr:LamG-like jellyroll fold domain-containing protein [Planctomycetota bacterium]
MINPIRQGLRWAAVAAVLNIALAPAVAPPPHSNGLVAYWKLDDLASPSTDSSGSGISGTWKNTPTPTAPGAPGIKFPNPRCLGVNGTTQYVDFGTPTALPSGKSARSISAWAKSGTTASGGRWIFSYGSPTTHEAMSIGMNGTSLTGGGFNDDLTVAGFWNTSWHFIVLTYDGTTAVLYGDGHQVATAAKAWNLVSLHAYIGRLVSGGDYWNGLIDDVRVYDRVLTPDEITALAAGSTEPAAPTNLTAVAGPDRATLSWTAVPNATSYEVLRSTVSGGPYTSITPTGVTTPTFVDTGVTAGTTYYYVVVALTGVLTSDDSNEASCTPFLSHINVSPATVTVVELGGTTFFTVTLTQPIAGTNTVHIPVTVDPANGTTPYPVLVSTGASAPASTFTLTFDGTTGLTQNVIVTGQDDNIANNPRPFTIHLGTTTSGDPFYNGITYLPPVTGTQIESDVAGFIVNPPSGLVAVDGGTPVTFTIQASSIPHDDVVVNLALSNPEVATLTTTGPITFTHANWSTPVTVTVTPLDDKGANPSVFFAVTTMYVTLTPDPTSTDALYRALPAVSVPIGFQDNYAKPPLPSVWGKKCGLIGVEGAIPFILIALLRNRRRRGAGALR